MKRTLRKIVYVLLMLSLVLACIPATVGAFPIQLGKPFQLRTETIANPAAVDPDQWIRTVKTTTAQAWPFSPFSVEEYLTDPGEAGADYNFLQRSNATFQDHTRDAEFETDEFNAAYHMSQTDFDPNTACAHSYTSVVTSPTCTEDGYTTYTCTECGYSYTETIWATGHLSTHLENQRNATCGAGGYSGDIVCDTCGQIVGYGYTIWPTDAHNYDSQVTTEAGCEADGVMTYTCTECGYSYTETICATGHYYDAAVTDPTCIAQGYTTHTCAYCGDVFVDSYMDALGHNYSYVETPPTCTEDGSKTYTCHCGDTNTEMIPAIGHSYTSLVTAPTCTENGYTTYSCVNCGDTYTDNYVDTLGHNYSETVIPPSCTEQGYTYYACIVCGYTYQDNFVEANGHSYSELVIPPSCTEQGYTYYTCTVCSYTYQDNVVEAYGHSHTDVVIAPTCTNEGFTFHTCTTCGYECKDTYVEALGHSWDGGVVTAPTCTEQGYTSYSCTADNCGIGYRGDFVEAKGHSYTPYVTPPTCTQQGYTSYYCSECDYYYRDNYTEARGHEVEDGNCIYCYAPFEGYCGDDLTWVLREDMVLTISGTGEMWDYGYDDYGNFSYSPWHWASESIQTVVIEEGVTSIGYDAFTYCDNVNRVYVADIATLCANGAIGSGNKELYLNGQLVTELVIPDGVTSIANGAFYGFDSLLSVTIPDSVTNIGVAFNNCTSLVFNEYDNVCYLGNEENPYFALIEPNDSYSITSCTIHADTRVIAERAFDDCKYLLNITIPDNVTSIGDGAFSGCESLSNITITDGVTSIGDFAFYGCESLTNITIPDSVTSIGYDAFGGCPSPVFNRYDNAYYLGNEENPYFALIYGSNSTSSTIHGDTKLIASAAFFCCESLTNVTIGSGVTSIGDGAFGSCTSLWHVLYQGTETQWNAIDIRGENKDLTDAIRHYNCTGEEVTDAVNHVCQICGPEEVPECDHFWDEGVVTLDPGCETTGQKTFTCTKCGKTHTEDIAATGHYTIPVGNEQAPTCGSDGYTGDIGCDICGKIIEYGVVIEATGMHEYTSQVNAEPTCTTEGSVTHTCHCGDSYTEVLPKTVHSFVDGQCENCGAPAVLLGDANGDGKVNARDARLILRYAAKLIGAGEGINLAAADYNGDGNINARDARALLRAAAGLG